MLLGGMKIHKLFLEVGRVIVDAIAVFMMTVVDTNMLLDLTPREYHTSKGIMH